MAMEETGRMGSRRWEGECWCTDAAEIGDEIEEKKASRGRCATEAKKKKKTAMDIGEFWPRQLLAGDAGEVVGWIEGVWL